MFEGNVECESAGCSIAADQLPWNFRRQSVTVTVSVAWYMIHGSGHPRNDCVLNGTENYLLIHFLTHLLTQYSL